MNRYLTLAALVVLLYGCASVPGISYVTESRLGPEKTFWHLVEMSEQCFSRTPTPFRDGKLVRYSTMSNGENIITLHHYASDIGVLEAELTILIGEDGRKVTVHSTEISDQTEKLVLDRAENIKRIKLWAQGDSKCASL